MALHITTDNFSSEVLESSLPVMVDFYADWCGPCKMMAPVVDALAAEYDGKVKIGKLNVDEASDIAQRYGIMSIPTLLFFKNGEVAHKIVGAVAKSELEQQLDAL